MTSTRAPRNRSSAVAKAQRAGQGSRTIWVVAAVVLVIAFAAIMAVALAQESSDSSSSGDQTAEVTITGSPLPRLPQNGASEAVGMTAPELSGTSLTGEPMSITNDGTPRVMAFFTHWCPACQAEVPVVSEWYNSSDVPDDVDFVAVNTAVNPSSPNYPPSQWYEREDWEVPTLLDDAASSAANAYGLSAYPYWTVVDADGNVVTQRTGQLGVAEILELFEAARAGAGA